jgi:hypothetical protein
MDGAQRPRRRRPGQALRPALHCSQSFRGGWALDGWLSPLEGSIFAKELARLAELEYLKDKKAKRDELGREPLDHELDRTPAQRSADALVQMAERSAVDPDRERKGSVLLVIHVGHEGFERTCRATNGVEVRPGEIVPRLSDSIIQRVVFDGKDNPIAVSEQRFFRGALRLAIEARDQYCQFPYCDEPIDRCQVDHKLPAAVGGPTALWNGRLGCGPDNGGRHRHRHHDRCRSGDDPPSP